MTTRRYTANVFFILPWIICGLGALFYCYEYLLRVSPSVMTFDLMRVYHIDAAELGYLTAFYYYIYTPMQLPVGVLMDRYGPRRLLTIASLVSAIGMYLFASSHYLALAEFGRFLIGFGSAFAFVGVLKLATIWLPQNLFAFIAGLTLMLGMVGAMVGDLLLTSLVNFDGWKSASYLAAGFGAVLTVILFFVLRDTAKGIDAVSHEPLPNMKSAFRGLFIIVKNPQIWVNGIIGCLLYISLSAFAELWGIPYLEEAYNFSNTDAAMAMSFMFLGWAIGAPFCGWLSDYIKQRRLLMTMGAAVSAILFSAILYVPHISKEGIYITLFIIGLFSSAQILVFAISREISPEKSVGTAIALTNMIVMLGGVMLQPLIGYLLDFKWAGQMVDGVRVYSVSDYQYALAILPISLVVTVFLSFFLKETNCKFLRD